MKSFRISLEDDELEYVQRQGKGWMRNVVRRFMDTEGALTSDELIYLRDHGGTHGVIRIAQSTRADVVQVDLQTGEVLS